MIFERRMINWLYNRNGLNYSKFQKYCEMEIRYEAIKEKWDENGGKCPPGYSVDRYINHYFHSDFEKL